MANISQSDPASSNTSTKNAIPPSPTPEWDTDIVVLKDFAAKKSVPGFAKIIKGNYMNLGSSKFPFQRQHSEVFIHSVKVSVKVLAHCLRRVDTGPVVKPKRGASTTQSAYTRVYAVDQRLAIPISYQGWFELLSEDGKSARPITSVHELSKVKPEKVLVRENMKCYLQSKEGKMSFDSTKIVLAGEQLLLCEELTLPSPTEKTKSKLLRCFDSKGEQIFLSFDQKGTFTPIAGENDFTGVFTIRDVVRRFRLPLTVKLIQGVRPRVDPTKFTGLIRLDWVYSDETAFVSPLEKNHIRLLPIPVDANLQLVTASNQSAMKSSEFYNVMSLKCNRMISNYNNTIHLIVNLPDAATRGKSRQQNSNVFSGPIQQEKSSHKRGKARVKEEKIMDEIDNLYGYVRDGGAPPKFEYDSDEESYFEEPAYEPLDEFRARLKALEAGEKVQYHSRYEPHDVSKLVFENDPDRIDDENPYGVINGGQIKTNVKAPPLPPRPSFDLSRTPSSGSPANSTKTPPLPTDLKSVEAISEKHKPIDQPPPIPPRRVSQPELFFTTVSTSGVISSHQSTQSRAANSPKIVSPPSAGGDPTLTRKTSMDNQGSSNHAHGQHSKLLARDFKDSDISSMTKQSSGSSSGARKPSARKKMQTLYL